MGNMKSFTGIENELSRQYREQLDAAEDTTDLSKIFSRSAANFLKKVLGEHLGINEADINFTPTAKELFQLSPKIHQLKEFKEVEKESDLIPILSKWAESAHHRYIHLIKHTEKTNKKFKY